MTQKGYIHISLEYLVLSFLSLFISFDFISLRRLLISITDNGAANTPYLYYTELS